MSVPNKHGLFCVSIGATTLGEITRQTLATGAEVRGDAMAGEIYRRYVSLYAQRYAPGFSTRSLKTALDACGVVGASIAGMSGGLALYAQKHADGSTRAGAGSHRKYAFSRGILYPRTLSCDHRGDATIDYEAVVVGDGVNEPIVITDDVSLPSAPALDGIWTLGPVSVGGISLAAVRQVRVEFGIEVASEGGDSELWDTHSSIRAINPTVTLRGIDVLWLKSNRIPTTGKATTHANSTIYLRKRAVGGSFVANGTAQHIKITAAGMAVVDNACDANENNGAETSITWPCYFDGTNAPVEINTASAIT